MKRIQIMLLALLLMTFTACSNAPETSFSESSPAIITEEKTSTDPVKAEPEIFSSQKASADTEPNTQDTAEEYHEEYSKAPIEEAPQDEPPQEISSSQAVNNPPPDERNEKGFGTPEPEEVKPHEKPSAEESKSTGEPPIETKPEENSNPEPEPETTQEPEPVPQFDIDYWISYAKSAAESKGLVLDSSAVDCWDNPITANPDCIYLERDINSRLNRYAGDEDITDVWIWYECTGPNRYLIYIGYA